MIRLKVAFVLQMIDDFSGQYIKEKGFQFYIGKRIVSPIQKRDGMYIFLEPQEEETRIIIQSTYYHPCSILVRKKFLNPAEPVLEVRLYRKAGTIISSNVKLLSGEIENRQRIPIEVYAKKKNPAGISFKEYKNIDGEHRVWFSGFTKDNLIGKTCLLNHEENLLFLILQEKKGMNEYQVDIISGEPEKIKKGTPLYQIYRSVTDCNGKYNIPVENTEDTENTEVFVLQKQYEEGEY